MSSAFQSATDALKNLKEALTITNPSDLERDGTIQRFEICYDQTWKIAQRILKDHEVQTESPKSVFRELGRLGWIDNVEAWLAFQKSRNETSHEYGKVLTEKSIQLALVFLPMADRLLQILKEKSLE